MVKLYVFWLWIALAFANFGLSCYSENVNLVACPDCMGIKKDPFHVALEEALKCL